jgi:hypothetical protein
MRFNSTAVNTTQDQNNNFNYQYENYSDFSSIIFGNTSNNLTHLMTPALPQARMQETTLNMNMPSISEPFAQSQLNQEVILSKEGNDSSEFSNIKELVVDEFTLKVRALFINFCFFHHDDSTKNYLIFCYYFCIIKPNICS